ncbi:MAG: NADP-dependent malic enzyme [Alphaproteobacteria bacterium]
MASEQDRLAQAAKPMADAMRLHKQYRGKVQVLPKCPVSAPSDFAIWYTPGVAAPCRAIEADRKLVYEYTNKGNSIAVVSDGSRVLGLGNIGPEAGLPVMEGKALLFKYLGGVDAVPICLKTQEPDEIVRAVEWLQPSFGGINLEDIAQPKCFRVLDALRQSCTIPVWHDDQQGSATVLLAGLINALRVVGKDIRTARLTLVGIGAANFATYRLLKSYGVDPAHIIACDKAGTLHGGRADIEAQQATFAEKWQVCRESNADNLRGGIEPALRGADICIAFSHPDPTLIKPEWVRGMARDAIVFACANPEPEIWPWLAREAGARIVGTGRSDFPNQVNNSLAFPGIFRGVLDVRARTITDGMAIAAAEALAGALDASALGEQCILPGMDDWQTAAKVAAATAMQAQAEGVAGHAMTHAEAYERARRTIADARAATACLMQSGSIAAKAGQ